MKEQSASVFKEQGEATDEAKDKLIEQLYKTIGSLTMDVEFLKKAVAMSKEECKSMVSKGEKLSVCQQCELLGLCWTSLYHIPSEEMVIMRLMYRQYAITPFYGKCRLKA